MFKEVRVNRETEAKCVKLFFAGRGHGHDMGGQGWSGRRRQKRQMKQEITN